MRFISVYIHGYGGMGKAGIALVEGAADVFTLGLAEVVSTPAEAATRNERHPVTFCYSNAKLVRLSEDGNVIAGGAATGSSSQQASSSEAAAPSSPTPTSTPNSLHQ